MSDAAQEAGAAVAAGAPYRMSDAALEAGGTQEAPPPDPLHDVRDLRALESMLDEALLMVTQADYDALSDHELARRLRRARSLGEKVNGFAGWRRLSRARRLAQLCQRAWRTSAAASNTRRLASGGDNGVDDGDGGECAEARFARPGAAEGEESVPPLTPPKNRAAEESTIQFLAGNPSLQPTRGVLALCGTAAATSSSPVALPECRTPIVCAFFVPA